METSPETLRRALKKAMIQKWIGQIMYMPIGALIMVSVRYLIGCRIGDLQALRRQYAELLREKKPLLICSNHLTYVDSVLLMYAFGSPAYYAANYGRLSWNLPAMQYKSQPFFRFACYIGKCLFIDRSGTKADKELVLDVAREIVARNEVLTVFPEGRRSKTGYLDEERPAFGIGKIITKLDECRVLCVYMRADKQKGQSKFPPYGSRFRVLSELTSYRKAGPDQVGAITHDILERIRRLEDRYFAEAGQPKPVRALRAAGTEVRA